MGGKDVHAGSHTTHRYNLSVISASANGISQGNQESQKTDKNLLVSPANCSMKLF